MRISDGEEHVRSAAELSSGETSRWHELKEWRELLTSKRTAIPNAGAVTSA